MNFGKLRHRLILQSPTETLNEINEVVNVYADVVTVWGSVEPYTGTWGFSAKQINVTAKGRVKIRYRSDIEVTWRIKFGERYLTIISILNRDERNRELIIEYGEAQD
jgi:SPP1 family predicted phage head-tail adaptor